MATPPNLSSGASISPTPPRVTRGITQSTLTGSMVQPNTFTPRSSKATLQFPSDLPKYYFSLGISTYARKSIFEFAINATSDIILPLPKQLVDTDTVQYEQKEIGGAAAAAVGVGSAMMGQEPASNILNALGAMASGLVSQAGAAFGKLTGADAIGAGQAVFGAAPNQFTTVLLKGPGYKKHEFTWTLSPRNENESRTIRKIIVLLKNSMFVKNNIAYFGAPQIFTPKFFINEQYLYKFKPCVLENMTVNYSPSGAPAFYATSTAPDAVEIRLSFLEVEFWFAGEYS